MLALYRRVLGWFLHRANAHPPESPWGARDRFYRLKDRLLHSHGRFLEDDVQHLVDECWGSYATRICSGPECPRCGGTGIYRERFFVLERWELGGQVFHRPVARRYPRSVPARIIKGLIRHDGITFRQAHAALFCLTFVYDLPLWWEVFVNHRLVWHTAMNSRLAWRWRSARGCVRRWIREAKRSGREISEEAPF